MLSTACRCCFDGEAGEAGDAAGAAKNLCPSDERPPGDGDDVRRAAGAERLCVSSALGVVAMGSIAAPRTSGLSANV